MKPFSPRARAWAVMASLFILCAAGAGADPLIRRAHEREKAGDLQTAAALLASWLGANPGASGSPAVFGSYLLVEQDLPALLGESAQFLAAARGVPGSALLFEKAARLFDLAGRIEEARDAWLAAFAEGSPESSLVSAFLLSYQMNDIPSMSAALEKVERRGSTVDLLLQALSEIRKGDRTEARAALLEVAEQTASPELSMKALWVLYQADLHSGDPAAATQARSRLKSRFASAPETAIAAGSGGPGAKPPKTVVVEMATPVAFDAAIPAATVSPPTTKATVSVQAGSFLMKENADDLVAELSKRGFAPVVVYETVQGRDRYRVLAGTGLETDAAKSVLKRLSGEGYGGFIIADK
jgi:cell division septation protein DedD